MSLHDTPHQLINVKSLKLWASANLPLYSHLREILIIEEDSLTVQEFLVKMKIWLKLCSLESEWRLRR